MASRIVRIGNGAGFWGDNLDAPRLLAEAGGLDYLTLEYLAELTLSILAHQKSRQPAAGFVTDLPPVIASLVPALQAQPQLKIITNGGGMNPQACAIEVARILVAAGVGETRIAAVSGDDLLPRLDDLLAAGEPFANLETGRPLGELRSRVASVNAYLGAEGIVDSLRQDARIVLTGRVADASLTVAPAMYEHGWAADDLPRIAAATVAGHLIECGAQVTGGMFSAGDASAPLANIGYPIAEISQAGEVWITKPAGTGGLVNVRTVAEQLVYEIGDPSHYLTPDIDADFTQVRLTQTGPDRVQMTGAVGQPRPERFKVSLAYRDGYMAAGTLVIVGPRAVEKARAAGQMLLDRVRRSGVTLQRTNIECLGAGDAVPGVLPRRDDPPEVVLRVSVQDSSREAVERFCREFAPLVTSGPAGVTGYTGPRPKPYPVLGYWPTTIPRDLVRPLVEVRTAAQWANISD